MHFITNVLAHMLALIMVRVIFVIVMLFLALQCTGYLFAQEPGNYLYVSDLEFDNVGGGTSAQMRPVPVNALNYVNSVLIRADGTDRVFTDSDGVTLVSGFTQDMTINAANWWVFATITPSNITTEKVFHGGADADLGFPIVQNNIADSGDESDLPLLRATSTASLSISDLLDVRVDMRANIPCGWIAGKVGNFYQFATEGWALFSIGTLESSPANGGVSGIFNDDEIFFEITPINFPIWLCSVGSINTIIDLQRAAGGDITIQILDVDTGLQICTSKRVEIVFAIPADPLRQNQLLLPKPCLIEKDQHARIFMRQLGSVNWDSDDNGQNPSTSTNFVWQINAGCPVGDGCDISGAAPWHRTSVEKMFISFVNADIATSTGDLYGMVAGDFAQSNSNWDGSRATLQLSYIDPTLDVLQDSIVVASVAHAGGIATSTQDLRLARGFDQGIIYNFEIDAGVTTILDVDFDGDDINETVVGNVSNFHVWRGTIQDESGFNNDLEYLLTANMTNINSSVSGFQNNPTPTPIAGITGTSTAITGNPLLSPLFTPVPTPPTGILTVPLRNAASSSNLPTELWWIILSTIGLAIILGMLHKFFPNKPIFAALAIIGLAIVSLAAGEQFAMWIVALFGLWAFGSTTLVILWSR